MIPRKMKRNWLECANGFKTKNIYQKYRKLQKSEEVGVGVGVEVGAGAEARGKSHL